MTTFYAASDVADSFEDLSSLSSDKDIESLVLATTYSDGDDDNDFGKNVKSTDDSSKNNSKAGGPAKKEEEQVREENQKAYDTGSDDDDFVDLNGADVEDKDEEVLVLSEGWDSSRSTTPEPQDAHQAPSSWSNLLLSNYQTTSRRHENDSADSNKDSIAAATTLVNTTTKTSTNPIPMTSSLIPRIRIRMTSDILAKLNKPIPSASVTIVPSLPPDRVVATPSRLGLARQKVTKIPTKSATATATATTPDIGKFPSLRDKNDVGPKMAVLATFPPPSTVNETPTFDTTIKPAASTATSPGAATTTGTPQMQEESDGKCKAFRRSTGKRCNYSPRHGRYCSKHRLFVHKVSDSH
ncbi:hypothetical protein BGZ96_007876 [Linnemannia gamsii]|uniref:Uncharacterized protein n=1 Tax=Linnemannia gamsii TaxID=64522 RepID=A0ABQ7K055_9FUNG|nr:hypothetical protein BGZ96_007876 [Linnemannia gamsii]